VFAHLFAEMAQRFLEHLPEFRNCSSVHRSWLAAMLGPLSDVIASYPALFTYCKTAEHHCKGCKPRLLVDKHGETALQAIPFIYHSVALEHLQIEALRKDLLVM